MKTVMTMLIGISMSIMMIGCSSTVDVNEESAKLLKNVITDAWTENGYCAIFEVTEVKNCVAVNVIGNKYEGTAIVVLKGKKNNKLVDTHWSFESICDGRNIMIQKVRIDPREDAQLKEVMKWAQMSAICGWGDK